MYFVGSHGLHMAVIMLLFIAGDPSWHCYLYVSWQVYDLQELRLKLYWEHFKATIFFNLKNWNITVVRLTWVYSTVTGMTVRSGDGFFIQTFCSSVSSNKSSISNDKMWLDLWRDHGLWWCLKETRTLVSERKVALSKSNMSMDGFYKNLNVAWLLMLSFVLGREFSAST